MSRPRTVLLLSFSLLLTLGILWGQGVFSAVSTAPTVGTPVVQPSTLHVNQVTRLTVVSRITSNPGNAVVPASVKLERVDANGTIIANLGTMYDDGTHGDAVAGDGLFTVQVSLLEATPGTLRLQVAATFRAGPGRLASAVARVPIVTNTPPVANAGPNQTIALGTTVHLDGSQSSDVDGDALSFQWAVTATPGGSAATLSDPTAVQPTFVVARPGTYTVQLIVNDGQVDSAPASVLISTQNSPPVAQAGANQTVFVGTTVHLNGSQSYDVDGDALSFQWALTEVPVGSAATLSDPTAVQPTFVVDLPGTYTVQLIVDDGTVQSAPANVFISTQNSPPVARAGANQTVFVGTTVTLDGSASSDVDGDPLTFRWALTATPVGSLATLSDPTALQPTFVVDLPGTYVGQLIVNDGQVDSAPASVLISTHNSPPVAQAGPNQTVAVGTAVYLDGSQSHDVDGDALSFHWALTATPVGSLALLSDPTAVQPIFAVDFPGTYTVQLIVNDGTVNSAPASVLISTHNSPPVANAGPNQTVAAGTTVQLDGSQSHDVDGDPLSFHWALTATPVGSLALLSDLTAVQPTFVADLPGTYVGQLIVNDGQVDSAPATTTITAEATTPPPPINQASLTVGPGTNGQVTITGATGSVAGGAQVTITNTRTGQMVTVIANADGSFTATLAAQSGDTLSFITTDAAGHASAPATVTVGSLMAPPLDRMVATDLASATAFLYTGNQPIQTGVAAGTIEPRRAAVLRGQVRTRDGALLPGVTITIVGHPEYGSTLTRADGLFDMAVNGGGLLMVRYEKAPYIPVQRQVQTPWQNYVWVPEVVMTPYDPQVTTIGLTAAGMQVAQGSVQTDTDGTRQATLLFPQGTQATMALPDGSSQALATLSVRATEYTVGPNGPAAMPAALPPTSAYTYAVELSTDEAVAAGASEVQFTQPVLLYVENFLRFPVGESVPVGYYDRNRGVWVPSQNGRIIKIVSLTAGLADLDTDGNGAADDATTLAALGISDAERQRLASLYQPGQSLWRIPLTHFSAWDANWGWGPPEDAEAPDQPDPTDDGEVDDPSCQAGSIIQCQNQTLGEVVSLVGTPFTLHYQSDRVPGRTSAYTVQIPLSGAQVPASLQRIELEIEVAGRRFTQTFAATPNQRTTFTWDGQDAYGRTVQGSQPITVRIGYRYDGTYQRVERFGYNGNGIPITADRTRQEITLGQRWQGTIGPWDARAQNLGGWTLQVHHAYDPEGRVLYLGDGSRRSAHILGQVITTVAGNGLPGSFAGDGGPATQARLGGPYGIAVAPDGSFYIADAGYNRIRRVSRDGVITTVAGNGSLDFGGAEGLATQIPLDTPIGVAVGPDGNFYIAELTGHRIRRVDPNGIMTTVAGSGSRGYNGDGGPATQARLNFPWGIAVGADGSLYIADTNNDRIRRVGPDGIITTVVAGIGSYALTVGPDGTLYIANGNSIRRLGPDGILTTVVGSGPSGYSGDGGPATQAQLNSATGIAVGSDGGLYIVDSNNSVIRRVGPDGIITTVAGNAIYGYSGDGGQATQAQLDPWGIATGPDGNLYIADLFNHRIRRVEPPLPGFTADDSLIPSEDGSEVYVFDPRGQHQRTLHGLTGALRYQFGYDSAGRLTTVTDGDGNVTTIERDTRGNPTAIVAPFGQRTVLRLDANGYLASVTNPAGETVALTSDGSGLLTALSTPRGTTSRFSYDTLGRLLRDANPAGGFIALARTDGLFTYTATLTSVSIYS